MADALPIERLPVPLPRTRLMGRDGERARASRLLLGDALPLPTRTCSGGAAKTRLARAIAENVATPVADGLGGETTP